MVVRKKLEKERELLQAQYDNTVNTLNKFYSAGPIYGKYHHDFVAVSSFLDYLKSGMCQTLGERVSRDGAYNTYEEMRRLDRIISKLDQVIAHLEEIRDNQYTLYSAIQDGNKISAGLVEATNRLAASNEQIAENSAIAAYNSKQAANEAYQIKWLELLDAGKK